MTNYSGQSPLSGPGGGGGGGGDSGSVAYNGAAGWAGQAELLYAASGVPNNVVVRYALSVPPAGSVNGAVLVRALLSSGSLTYIETYYGTGGTVGFRGYNGATKKFDSGSLAFSVNGAPMMMSMELATSGSNVAWQVQAVVAGAANPIHPSGYSGTYSTATIGAVDEVAVNPAGTINDTAIGMVVVQYAYEDMVTSGLADALNGHNGELAGTRFARLCSEENIGGVLRGTAADTPKMGPQRNGTFMALLQQVEDADQGMIIEARDMLGLYYRTKASLSNQTTPVVLDYTANVLSEPLQPTPDDQLTRNDLTITRINGASISLQQTSGPLSMQDPPAGVGDYTYSLNAAVNADSQVSPLGNWVLVKGTVPDQRYPQITVDLARSETASLFGEVPGIDGGDFVQLTDMPAFADNPVVSQLAAGFTETMNAFKWLFEFSGIPESPYETNFLGSGPDGSPQNSGFEGGIGTWTATTDCSVAASTAQAHSGTGSMLMTATSTSSYMSAGHTTVSINNGLPVSPGEQVYASAWFLAAATPRTVNIQIDWSDNTGTYLSSSFANFLTDSTTVWTQSAGSVTAPASAAFAVATVAVDNPAASEKHYVDDVQLIGNWW